MTQSPERASATTTKIDTSLDNVQILNWGDYTRWCLYANPSAADVVASGATGVHITTAKAGEYTDHFTTWSIVPDGHGYVEIRHDHTEGYATATNPAVKIDNYVMLKTRTGNIDQKWRMQRHESESGMYVTVTPKINENLSAAAAFKFSPVDWGYLVLRTRARNEWPTYLFILDFPDQWQDDA